jgi:hypothetical protein
MQYPNLTQIERQLQEKMPSVLGSTILETAPDGTSPQKESVSWGKQSRTLSVVSKAGHLSRNANKYDNS